MITDPQHADEIITSGQADLVFIGQKLLREPYWAIKAQHIRYVSVIKGMRNALELFHE